MSEYLSNQQTVCSNTTVSSVVEAFFADRRAARYSLNTLNCYRVTFTKLINHLGDMPIQKITRADIIEFLNSQISISAKTLRNYHSDLSALWQWGVERGIFPENIIRSIRAPRAEKTEILPFEKTEIRKLIGYAAKSENQVIRLRNRAILFLLLDSGVRASELCGLKIRDINEVTKHIVVFGKGKKQRLIPISDLTLSAIQEYLCSKKTEKRISIHHGRKSPDKPRSIRMHFGKNGQACRRCLCASTSFSPYICDSVFTQRRRSLHFAGFAGTFIP